MVKNRSTVRKVPRRSAVRLTAVALLAVPLLPGSGLAAAGAAPAPAPGAVPESVTCDGDGTAKFTPPITQADPTKPDPVISVSGHGTLSQCVHVGGSAPLPITVSGTWKIVDATIYGDCGELRGFGRGEITWKGGPHDNEVTKIIATGVVTSAGGTGVAIAYSGPYKSNVALGLPTPFTIPDAAAQCLRGNLSEVSGKGAGGLYVSPP